MNLFGDAAGTSMRRGSVVAMVAVLAAIAVIAVAAAPAFAASKPSVTVLNDADHDGTFSAVENVAKSATYPWTVTYQLTLDAGSFQHKIVSIQDNTTNNLMSARSPSCSTFVGTTIAANTSITCYYDGSIGAAGGSPLVNTATVTWDNAGGDTASGSSTVNFPALSISKSSTTTLVTAIGQVVPYSYLVTDTGTSTLTGVTVSDNNVDAPPVCPQSTLAPGASMTCTAAHTVTLAEANAGSVSNTGTASSNEAPDANSSLTIPVGIVPSSGGAFVVGDKTVGPLSGAVGESVTFWGAQWWKLNSLSGGTGPAAFKGFEDSTPAPVCGVNWTTDPGNSAPPPASIPPYMAIIVASQVSQNGSSISGDVLHLVIVKTNPGYQGNPGHAGTGSIVSVVC